MAGHGQIKIPALHLAVRGRLLQVHQVHPDADRLQLFLDDLAVPVRHTLAGHGDVGRQEFASSEVGRPFW